MGDGIHICTKSVDIVETTHLGCKSHPIVLLAAHAHSEVNRGEHLDVFIDASDYL